MDESRQLQKNILTKAIDEGIKISVGTVATKLEIRPYISKDKD